MSILARFHRWKWQRFMNNRQDVAKAPFNVVILEKFLDRLKTKYGKLFTHFNESSLPGKQARLFFRFDLDTLECLKNAPSLIKVCEKRGITPAIFIRTDWMDYSQKDLAKVIALLKDSNCLIGLHSSCYIFKNEWQAKLTQEVASLEDLLGQKIDLVTAHDFGERDKIYRDIFYQHIASGNQVNGRTFFMDVPPSREYEFVFQDCWLDESGNRVIKTEFGIFPGLKDGRDYLVLIHPCYWAV